MSTASPQDISCAGLDPPPYHSNHSVLVVGFSAGGRKSDVLDPDSTLDDCCICADPPLHPVKLPCRHIFCFLCIKGVYLNDPHCPYCRTPIPKQAIEKPDLVKVKSNKKRKSKESSATKKRPRIADGQQPTTSSDSAVSDSSADPEVWFYQARNGGWWKYDERTNHYIEQAVKDGRSSIELLLAGHLYVLDLDAKVQMQKNNPSIKRNMKKDRKSSSSKGIAGLNI